MSGPGQNIRSINRLHRVLYFDTYDQHDAEGFINIFGLPLQVEAILEREGARPSKRRDFK